MGSIHEASTGQRWVAYLGRAAGTARAKSRNKKGTIENWECVRSAVRGLWQFPNRFHEYRMKHELKKWDKKQKVNVDVVLPSLVSLAAIPQLLGVLVAKALSFPIFYRIVLIFDDPLHREVRTPSAINKDCLILWPGKSGTKASSFNLRDVNSVG